MFIDDALKQAIAHKTIIKNNCVKSAGRKLKMGSRALTFSIVILYPQNRGGNSFFFRLCNFTSDSNVKIMWPVKPDLQRLYSALRNTELVSEISAELRGWMTGLPIDYWEKYSSIVVTGCREWHICTYLLLFHWSRTLDYVPRSFLGSDRSYLKICLKQWQSIFPVYFILNQRT